MFRTEQQPLGDDLSIAVSDPHKDGPWLTKIDQACCAGSGFLTAMVGLAMNDSRSTIVVTVFLTIGSLFAIIFFVRLGVGAIKEAIAWWREIRGLKS